MSTFIQLTALTKNGKPFAKEVLVDVNKINEPIYENVGSNSILVVDTDLAFTPEYSGRPDKIEVDQDLTAIDLLTDEVFRGTVITIDNRTPKTPSDLLFIKSRVVGVIEAVTPGGNSKFLYKTVGKKSPTAYEITQNLAAINA